MAARHQPAACAGCWCLGVLQQFSFGQQFLLQLLLHPQQQADTIVGSLMHSATGLCVSGVTSTSGTTVYDATTATTALL